MEKNKQTKTQVHLFIPVAHNRMWLDFVPNKANNANVQIVRTVDTFARATQILPGQVYHAGL